MVLKTVVGSEVAPSVEESEPCDDSGVEQAERRRKRIIRRNRWTWQALVQLQRLEINAPSHVGLHSLLTVSVSVTSSLAQSRLPVHLLIVGGQVGAA